MIASSIVLEVPEELCLSESGSAAQLRPPVAASSAPASPSKSGVLLKL